MIFTSSISLECGKNYPELVKQSLDEKGFGFVFSTDYFHYNGKAVENIFVYHARSLYESKGKYQPIYKQLTKDLLSNFIEIDTQRKLNNVNEFVRTKLDYFRDNNISSAVNGLLQGEDEVTLNGKNIMFSFSGMEEKIDIEVLDN